MMSHSLKVRLFFIVFTTKQRIALGFLGNYGYLDGFALELKFVCGPIILLIVVCNIVGHLYTTVESISDVIEEFCWVGVRVRVTFRNIVNRSEFP